LLNHKC